MYKQEERAREKADWNCEKSGKIKNFITKGNVPGRMVLLMIIFSTEYNTLKDRNKY